MVEISVCANPESIVLEIVREGCEFSCLNLLACGYVTYILAIGAFVSDRGSVVGEGYGPDWIRMTVGCPDTFRDACFPDTNGSIIRSGRKIGTVWGERNASNVVGVTFQGGQAPRWDYPPDADRLVTGPGC